MFNEDFYQLRALFNAQQEHIEIPGSNLSVINCDFLSRPVSDLPGIYGRNDIPCLEDSLIRVNNQFKYPVFVPTGAPKFKRAIILLHGLNERNWHKHLSWAKFLCENTGKPVILFPISFHMNRGLPGWSDKNELSSGLEIRSRLFRYLKESSIFNFILSKRLTEIPQRFFISGYQSATDIMDLMKTIKRGEHSLFEPETRVDFFSYSIGVFLIQCLIIANQEELFNNSRFVFFAGGALFEDMKGISRYIMDSVAFERIYKYYLTDLKDEMKLNSGISGILTETILGKAFISMVSKNQQKDFREKQLRKYKSRILYIGLFNDKIIPLNASLDLLLNTACDKDNIKIMDFKFPSIHENPFPVNLKEYSSLVNQGFHNVFMPSAEFLA